MCFAARIIALWAVCGAIQARNTTYEWRKDVLGMKANESAVIYRGMKGQAMMLMRSDDAELSKTPFPQSTSLHDFQPNKYLENSKGFGTLAIKVKNTCFIGDISQNYDDVLREAKRRSDSDAPIQNILSKSRYIINKESKMSFGELLDYSLELAKFCSGAENYYSLIPVEPRLYPFWPPLWPWWWWPFCFWGPIIIYPDLNDPLW